MTIDPTNAGGANLIERAKNILLTPQAEWDRIAAEPADVSKIYIGYVLPLAALAAIAAFIGGSLIGASAFGISYRVPIVSGAALAVIQVVMSLVGVFLVAFVTNALAPTFASQADMGQAHKLSAYSATAGLLAGVFAIFPPLAVLSILGLYSLALLFMGLPRLMKTPEDKRVGYILTIIIVMIVVYLIIGAVMGAVRTSMVGLGGAAPFAIGRSDAPSNSARDATEGQITLPGGGTLDVGALEQAYTQGTPAVAPERLQGYLPDTLPGGFRRTSLSSSSAMGAAQAHAEYENGQARLRVEIVHMGAIGGITAMAGAMNVQENTTGEDGYRRVQTVDGRIVTEEVSASGGRVSYGVVGRGMAVNAEGSGGTSIDQARAAVDMISVRRLEETFN